jgi:hypothetical protein
VVEGLVPAIKPDDCLKKARPKRSITAKKIENYQATNIIEKQVKNTTKCFDIPSSKTHQFSNSFFVKTLINWNHLEDSVVCATSVESFKSALTNHQ